MQLFKLLFIFFLIITLNIVQAQSSFNVSNKTTGDTLLTIDNEGKVGIGTTAPEAGIHVFGGGYPSSFIYLQTPTGQDAGFRFYEDITPQWHVYNSAITGGLMIQNNAWQTVLFADQVSANVGIGTTTPSEMLEVADTIYSSVGGFKFPDGTVQSTSAFGGDNGFLSTGTFGTGTIPIEGAGTRMMWYPGKATFRTGQVLGTNWDDAQIGDHSIGIGYNNIASGQYSVALGGNNTANATVATALGGSTIASGIASTSMGNSTEARGAYSTAMGYSTIASGNYSMAMGQEIEATGSHSIAIALSDQNGLQITQDTTMAIMGGRVGIGTISPTTRLEVADTIYSTIGGFKFPDGTLQESLPGPGNANTLDLAYDQGGSGAGRTINADAGALTIAGTDGFLATGTYGSGAIPVEGPGTRMMWYPRKAAFRGGYVDGTQWDDSNNGYYSFASGHNTTASGTNSTAMGNSTLADGGSSTAMGSNTSAIGTASTAIGYEAGAFGARSIAMGDLTQAIGDFSTAIGCTTVAGGNNSTAMGTFANAGGLYSIAIGFGANASGEYSTAMGYYTEASSNYSMAMGRNTTASGFYSTAMGRNTTASDEYSTAMGYDSEASGPSSIAMGNSTIASGDYSTAMGLNTIAGGNNSTAMGSNIEITATGSFAIGDNSAITHGAFTTTNRFYARFHNGYRLYTDLDLSTGVVLNNGSSSWSSTSDSTKKENFKFINGEEVLNHISDFRLGSWNYIGQDPTQFRHYGPMAQEFFKAFGNDGIGVCGNDTTLASADVDGINMIAIQALEKRTSDLQTENKQLKAELAMLKSKIEKFESLFSKVEALTKNKKTQYAKTEDKSK